MGGRDQITMRDFSEMHLKHLSAEKRHAAEWQGILPVRI
jgi:hypothetical protein